MITPEMIKAGKKAYWGHVDEYSMSNLNKQIEAIYEAMTAQKQQDAMIKYQSGELYESKSLAQFPAKTTSRSK